MIARMRAWLGSGWPQSSLTLLLRHGLALLTLFAIPLALAPSAKRAEDQPRWHPISAWGGEYAVQQVLSDPESQAPLVAIGATGAFYHTRDRGQTWIQSEMPLPGGSRFGRVLDLAVDPTDSRHIHLAIASSANKLRPMIYSTTNGGVTWRADSGLGPLRVVALEYGPSVDELYVVTRADIYRLSPSAGVSLAMAPQGDLANYRIADLNANEHVERFAVASWSVTARRGRAASRYFYLGVREGGLRALRYDLAGEAEALPLDRSSEASVFVREQATIHAICVHPNRTNTLCVGTDRGLYASVDAGESWFLTAPSLQNRRVLALLIDPMDNTVYAGVAGAGVAATRDEGATWEQLDAGLGHRSVLSLALSVDGEGRRALYAGTNDGLWHYELPGSS